MVTKAAATDRQYGRKYCSSRRISRASYAFPRTSSSCTRYRLPERIGGLASRREPFCSCGRQTGADGMGESKSDILQGTLDLMVLQTLEAMGPLHGYGV